MIFFPKDFYSAKRSFKLLDFKPDWDVMISLVWKSLNTAYFHHGATIKYQLIKNNVNCVCGYLILTPQHTTPKQHSVTSYSSASFCYYALFKCL